MLMYIKSEFFFIKVKYKFGSMQCSYFNPMRTNILKVYGYLTISYWYMNFEIEPNIFQWNSPIKEVLGRRHTDMWTSECET